MRICARRRYSITSATKRSRSGNSRENTLLSGFVVALRKVGNQIGISAVSSAEIGKDETRLLMFAEQREPLSLPLPRDSGNAKSVKRALV